VDDLISFNFVTTNSDVVNWCLRLYVGCEKVSPSGNNWMFSKRARPGIIYIPPLKDRTINFDPEDICVWSRNPRRRFCGHWIGSPKRSQEKEESESNG
jgi:hypothetical protein